MEKVKNVGHTVKLLSAIIDPEIKIESSRLTKQFLYLQTQRSVIAIYKYHKYPPLSYQTFLTEQQKYQRKPKFSPMQLEKLIRLFE